MRVEVAQAPIGRELTNLSFAKVAMKYYTLSYNEHGRFTSQDINNGCRNFLTSLDKPNYKQPGITYNNDINL